jgi:hypothetical protein
MKANELRIGNWVMSANYKKIKREIKDYSVEVIRAGDIHHLETFPSSKSIKPIPLTEEWLLKFGFEKKYDTFEFNGLNVDGCVVHFSFDKWASEYEIENCDYTEVPSDIQHVHQLQNLYFALTGEELTINKL